MRVLKREKRIPAPPSLPPSMIIRNLMLTKLRSLLVCSHASRMLLLSVPRWTDGRGRHLTARLAIKPREELNNGLTGAAFFALSSSVSSSLSREQHFVTPHFSASSLAADVVQPHVSLGRQWRYKLMCALEYEKHLLLIAMKWARACVNLCPCC